MRRIDKIFNKVEEIESEQKKNTERLNELKKGLCEETDKLAFAFVKGDELNRFVQFLHDLFREEAPE